MQKHLALILLQRGIAMEHQEKENHKGTDIMKRKLKKIGVIFVVVLACVFLIITACIGYVVYEEMKLGKNVAETKETSASELSEIQEDEYIGTPIYNESLLYASEATTIPISCSDNAYTSIMDTITDDSSDFRMAEFYALEDALKLYQNTVVNKSTTTTLLTNGMLDADKLFETVIRNNDAVVVDGKNTLSFLYTDLGETQIKAICEEIAKMVNSEFNEVDVEKIANTLERLTIFERKGSASNAYITAEITFAYNPGMIELYSQLQEALDTYPDSVWAQVVNHEILHLIQYSANDGDDSNGLEAGFCRKYNFPDGVNNIPVDSLYFSWILEAGAELGMADYLNVEPGTYQKKISYASSFDLSRFYEIDSKQDMLENIVFKHTLEEVFETLGLDSESEKQEFLKFMYSIEITQTEPSELWEYYESQTGRTLTDEEKTGIRMDIRTDAVKYLTKSFFMNVTNAVHDGAITDLDSLFYLLRLWELDVFNHLEYTKVSSLAHAEDFVLWYDQTQKVLLTAIAESSGIDPAQIQTLYSEYSLRIKTENNEVADNCNLAGLSSYMQDYVVSRKENYASSKFSRIHDVADWLRS